MRQCISEKDLKAICGLKKEWSPENISVKKLGGQTNRNWLVVEKRQKFFVRLPWERGDVVDRNIEGRNILRLSQNKKLEGILPLYFVYVLDKKNILNPKSKELFHVPDGTMVAEYIEGKELTPSLFSQKKYQKGVAQLLYVFHASKVRFVNPYNPLRDEAEKYRASAQKHSLQKFFSSSVQAGLAAMEHEAEGVLAYNPKGISTHNDVILQNILVARDGSLRLLDFEYAGLNTKGGILYDLGYLYRDSFFQGFPMKKGEFESFLAQADAVYGKKLDREQIRWAVIASLLVGIWWGIVRYWSVPRKERPYFLRYVKRGVRGALRVRGEIKKS
ncbi:MAG: phosphotransferase [Candidatus Wildermuthbacteria bacterium]|nr:phosphotransferase [Candidatus Wildermuthbacteria bacterium]